MIDIWQKRIDHGVDLLAQIAQVLNDIIEHSGPIDINNKTIWDGYLHRWSNEDWISVLWVLKNLMSQSPELFKPFHTRMIDDAIDALHQDQDHGIPWSYQ